MSIINAFVLKSTFLCKHRFMVQLLKNPPICRSNVVPHVVTKITKVEPGQPLQILLSGWTGNLSKMMTFA
jgi:hypothetical protein